MFLLSTQLRYVTLFLILCLISCSSKTTKVSPDKGLQSIAEIPTSFDTETSIPVSLSILQEINDGENLVIKAEVKPIAPTDIATNFIKDAVLQLTTFNEAKLINTKEVTLESLKVFGQPFALPFAFTVEISSHLATSYQIELAWGGGYDPMPESGNAKPAIVLENSNLEQNEHCEVSPCEYTYTFNGQMKNTSTNIIKEVTLGVSYVWEARGTSFDLSKYFPENEEMLVVENLNLGIGESAPIRLDLDRRVPARDDGRYRPVVRVVQVR